MQRSSELAGARVVAPETAELLIATGVDHIRGVRGAPRTSSFARSMIASSLRVHGIGNHAAW